MMKHTNNKNNNLENKESIFCSKKEKNEKKKNHEKKNLIIKNKK